MVINNHGILLPRYMHLIDELEDIKKENRS